MLGPRISVWLIISYTLSSADIGVRKSGPFKIELEKLTKCDDEGTGEFSFGTKITRTSDGRHVYSNPVYLGHPLDQNAKLHIELQSFSNGGYRPRFFHQTFKTCEDGLKYTKQFFKGFFQAANYTIENCPVPAGNYTVKDFDVTFFQVENFREFTYNKYKAIYTSYYNRRKTGCMTAYLEVAPN